MRRLVSRFGFLIALALAWSGAAQANLIWNLSNVTFSTGNCNFSCVTSTATGSFVVNTALNSILSWDITVAGATPLSSDHHYKSGVSGETSSFTSSQFYFANFGANFSAVFNPLSPLTNAGGTISLLTSSQICPGCSNQLKTGSVTTRSVPEPATLALLGVGLAGLAASRRRRTQ